jgi:hypothetical protein
MRQNGKEAKGNKQMKLFHLKSKRNETRKVIEKIIHAKKKIQACYCLEFIKMLNSLKRKDKNT